jgi:hypothetical protein
MAAVSEPDELTLLIARHLEVDWQYVRRIQARDAGYKITTRQSAPNDEGRVTVIVAVRVPPSQEDSDRMQERARLLMNRAYSDLMPPRELE